MTRQARVAIIGANGMLASKLLQRAPEAIDLYLFDLPELDITDAAQVDVVLGALQPEVIINCAAFTQVDNCEIQRDRAFAVNGEGPAHLASSAKKIGAVLVHISTDFVFSGEATAPYHEDAATEPLSVYGASKLQGEIAIANSELEEYFIIRTSWLYGPNGPNFVETIIRLAAEREELGIVSDQTGTPTYTGDLADAIWKLISPITHHLAPPTAPYGIYHYSNTGMCSWYEFASEIVTQLRAKKVSLKVKQVSPIATDEYPLPAKRPAYSVLSKDKIMAIVGDTIPPWQESLKKYLEERCLNPDQI
ncbi:MAG: dTDP-4-dehydrorhamnose reductase [Desulfuromonadaceae bacterium]|nr:dTDP-4-dehydrorhamnose reductase [Desulfuromonadaceae bacterium]